MSDVSSSLSQLNIENDFIPDATEDEGNGNPQLTRSSPGALQTFTTGFQASNVITGGLSYPIQVMADPTTIAGGQSLLTMPIYSSSTGQALKSASSGNSFSKRRR